MQQSSVGYIAEKDLHTASIFESIAGYYVTSDSESAAAARRPAAPQQRSVTFREARPFQSDSASLSLDRALTVTRTRTVTAVAGRQRPLASHSEPGLSQPECQ
jgi:hypothetical protein